MEEVHSRSRLEFNISNDGILRFGMCLIIHWLKGSYWRKRIVGLTWCIWVVPRCFLIFKRLIYWWKNMKMEIAQFVEKCFIWQVKVEHKRSLRLLQPLSILERKWEHISMVFLFGLPRSPRNHNAIWVMVDRLTKSSHFVLFQMNYSLDKLAELYIN